MARYVEIIDVIGRQILDSRGNPTVEADVIADNGDFLVTGRAAAPSGASKGSHEAHELRDGGSAYGGKGVRKAVEAVSGEISECLAGMNCADQCAVDNALIELDGTSDKSRLGANATIAVSLACADAAAKSLGLSLYGYLGGVRAKYMPLPMMNVINGGIHAKNNIDIQEFMIIPISAESISQGIRQCSEVYHTLGAILAGMSHSTAVGDEGGYAPNLKKDEDALKLLVEAVAKAGYTPGVDFAFALDVASSDMYSGADGGIYLLPKSGKKLSRDMLSEYLTSLTSKYPIISIEDGMAEDDNEGWKLLTKALGSKIKLVGDDLFATNRERLKKGIKAGIANSILIKPNQCGTLSETLATVEAARSSGYGIVVSHRSGETSDSFIADLAVAVNADMIKAGAPARGERTAKYNRLIRIEEEMFIGKQ